MPKSQYTIFYSWAFVSVGDEEDGNKETNTIINTDQEWSHKREMKLTYEKAHKKNKGEQYVSIAYQCR